MSTVVEKFLRYIKFDTTSDENSKSYPSTSTQIQLLSLLANELKAFGLEIDFDGKYVIAKLPKTESKTTVCFLAHVDTSDAVSGANVNPIITKYNGGDIILPHTVIRESQLQSLKGKTIITSDGSTLLGADDKAGVAEIMSLAEYFYNNPSKMRCNIVILFTPDEEIGKGTEYLDLEKLGADFAYSVDGGLLGSLEYENFNAASLCLTVNGHSTHPGSAKGKMKNAIDLFSEFHSMLPNDERPATTDGYEGFYMVSDIVGKVDKVNASYIIRDHDKAKFENKKSYIRQCVEKLNAKYGDDTFIAEIKDSYYNMKDIINNYPKIIEVAKNSFIECNVEPIVSPIRGGTDGAKLSFMGLPCPNLSTGGENFHSKEEFVCVESMQKMVEVLIAISKNLA